MTRLMLSASVAASAIALGYVVYAFAMPGRRGNMNEQTQSVNLADVATVQIAPSFKPTGPGTTNAAIKNGFDPATLEFHDNERQITFRFEQNQRQNMGGYKEDPVLLNVTLYNPSLPGADVTRIAGTTISRFYAPVDDEPRKAAHFAAQEWLPEITQNGATTRSAATNKGRGDNLVSGPPARWLVIHVDPVRKVRVDMYVWQKMYSLNDARILVQKVAQSIQPTPKLAAVFASVKSVDDRLSARHLNAVDNTIAHLKACGIQSLKAGETVFSGACAAWRSPNSREIHVARAVGRVPLSAATGKFHDAPQFTLQKLTPGKPAALIGPPDFQPAMFYWHAATSKWQLDGFGEQMYGDESKESPLAAAIAARLADHASVYVMCLARYDLQFHADRVAVDAFLAESNRYAAALRAGTLLKGVNAVPDEFGK